MTVMSLLVKVTLVLSVAAVIQIVLARRMSAATRHLVWTLAIGGVLLLPPLAGSLPEWSAVQYIEPAGVSPVFQSVVPAAPTTGRDIALPNAAAGPRVSWLLVLSTFYLAGVTLLLVRVVLQHVWTHRLVRGSTPLVDAGWLGLLEECRGRLGVRRPVRLLRAAGDTMPMAAGVGHASIVLPAAADTWPEDRRRAVLLHELAHVERHDCLTQTLADIACAAYWLHPGVWWIASRLRAERELACDDRVLSAGENAREYAGHLLELAYTLGHTAAPSVAVTMARPRELEGRMLAVLDAARNRGIPARQSRLAGLALLCAVTLPVAAATITPRVHAIDAGDLSWGALDDDAHSAAPASRNAAQAQTQRPRFDVVSIKRTPDDTGPGADFTTGAGGTLRARNNAVSNFITNAFGVPNYLVVGGPDWLRVDRYDMEARAEGEPSRAQLMLMLQVLLEERFQLRTHRETRDMPAYVLTVARGGARLQPGKDCIEPGSSKPVPPPAAGAIVSRRCGNNRLTTVKPPNMLWMGVSIDMRQVAGTLAGYFRRPVVDRTGLTGVYDVNIELPPLQPVVTNAGAADSAESVFTVLQEQLGLRVEEGRGPVDVLVIDRIERPTDN